MNAKPMVNLETKRSGLGWLGLCVCGSVLALGQSSCSTAGSAAWSKIQDEGLIPYLAEHSSLAMQESEIEGYEGSPEWQIAASEFGLEPRDSLESEVAFTAQAVEGKPGFVFSPHTPTPRQVDVRGYRIGERVRCPYTNRVFVVPGGSDAVLEPAWGGTEVATSMVLAPSVAASSASSRTEHRPGSQSAAALLDGFMEEVEEGSNESELAETLPLGSGSIPSQIGGGSLDRNLEPISKDPLSQPLEEASGIPVGKRVPGKPNYVFSPFAASNQVVDVEGHAPGTKVKCPYSGNIFEVPEAAPVAGAAAETE